MIRFFGNVPQYRGGFNVASADIDHDLKDDILLTSVNSGSSNDPFSGELRIFTASQIPLTLGNEVATPFSRINAFSSDVRGIGIHLLDADRNGVLERIDLSVQLGGNDDDRGRVKRFDPNNGFGEVDTIFANPALFGAGMEI